jgi:DNA-binding response OmpR family regulator
VAEPARLLLADDEETFLYATADLLRGRGYLCDCVSSADDAVLAIAAQRYDLLIADIKMPGNPRLELVRGLQGAAGTLPVIIVTGYPTLESALEAIRLPVIAYLTKPFEFQELVSQVEKGVKWSRVSRVVGGTRDRLEQWTLELSGVEVALRSDTAEAHQQSIDAFLSVTFRNMVGSLTDILRIAQVATGQTVAPEACHLLNCPRHARLMDAINDAIGSLEKTKTSFKSRELGELRRTLQSVVDEERGA